MQPYRIVQRVEDLPDLKSWKQVVIDTEGSGTSVHNGDRMCGIAVGALGGFDCYYIPIRHKNDKACTATLCEAIGVPDAPVVGQVYGNLPVFEVFAWLREHAEDPAITWVMHNAVFDLGMFRAEGIEFAGKVVDTMIVMHDLRSDLPNYGLDWLAAVFMEETPQPWYRALKAWFKAVPAAETWIDKVPQNYSQVPVWLLGMYGCEDIDLTRRLCLLLQQWAKDNLKDRLPNQGNPSWTQRELIANDLKLTRVLFEMNWNGIKLDVAKTLKIRERTLDEIEYYHGVMYRLAGRPFHVGSFKELTAAFERAGGRVLFWMRPKDQKGKQKLDHFTTDKSKSTGRPCWNAAAVLKYLERFRREGNSKAFEFVLACREAQQRQRLLSTYIDAYLSMCDVKGFVHCSFKQHGTRTGRLSSAQPNMQNVAKPKGNADSKAMDKFLAALTTAKDEPDALAEVQKGDEPQEIEIPDFVEDRPDTALAQELRGLFVARPGCQLVSIDYSQIEYRTAAYFSCDPVLLERYLNDPNTDYHQATAELMGVDRDIAKTINFGTLYGMGPGSLASVLTAQGLPTSVEGAKRLLNRLFDARPKLRQMIMNISQGAARRGHVQNPYGRVCLVPEARSYVGLNYLVQGSCGDMMRAAMVRVAEAIKKNGWPVLMLLTVHDELVFDIPTHLVAELAPLLAMIMCDVPEIKIPILCDIEVGPNWGDQVPLKEWVAAQAA